MREQTSQKIRVAAQLYVNGITSVYLIAGALKTDRSTIYRWSNTDEWKRIAGGNTSFREECHRKNMPLFLRLKKRYHSMGNVDGRNKIAILLRDAECNVSETTLYFWRKFWEGELFIGHL